jgi:hypothetical protein
MKAVKGDVSGIREMLLMIAVEAENSNRWEGGHVFIPIMYILYIKI